MKGRSSDAQRMREVLAPLTSIEPVRTGMEWVAFFSPPFSRVFVAKSRRRRQGWGGFLAPVARARRAPEAYFLLPHGRALFTAAPKVRGDSTSRSPTALDPARGTRRYAPGAIGARKAPENAPWNATLADVYGAAADNS